MLDFNSGLPARELQLYRVIWAGGFVIWLGCFAAWLYTASPTPWFWLGLIGCIVAVWFGSAVRYSYSVWPLSLLVHRFGQRPDANS